MLKRGLAMLLGFVIAAPFVLPYDLLLERALRAFAPDLVPRIDWGKAAYRFPRTLRIEDLHFYPSALADPLTFNRIDLTPALDSLLGRPGGTLEGAGDLGTYRFELATADDKSRALDARVEFDLSQARGGRFPLARGKGTITAALSRPAGGTNWTGPVRLAASGIEARSADVLATRIPAVTIGEVATEATFAGDRFQISSWETKGGNLSLGVTGSVILGKPVAASQLALVIQARPDASFLEALGEKGKNALRISGPDAGFTLTLGGTLAQRDLRWGN